MPVRGGVAASESPLGIHRAETSGRRPVLRHADYRLLESSVGFGSEPVLGIYLEPSPMVGTLRSDVVERLPGTESEVFADLAMQACRCLVALDIAEHLGIGHNQRFALPFEKQLLVLGGFVEIAVYLLYGLQAAFGRSEREHEGYLRSLHPVASRLGEDLA